MKLDQKTKEALQRLEVSPDFKVFKEYLSEQNKQLHEKAIWASEDVDVARGQAQHSDDLLKTLDEIRK